MDEPMAPKQVILVTGALLATLLRILLADQKSAGASRGIGLAVV